MTASYSDSFEQFWKLYPRKIAKSTAYKTWSKHIEGDAFLPTQITDDIKKRTRWHWWSDDKTKIPHPSTWLNQRRWEDEGWQDEIKLASTTPTVKTPDIDPGPELPIWQRIGNTTLLQYIRAAGGLEKIGKAVSIKNEVVREVTTAMNEELEMGTPFGECKWTVMQLLVDRLDHGLGLQLKHHVLKGA